MKRISDNNEKWNHTLASNLLVCRSAALIFWTPGAKFVDPPIFFLRLCVLGFEINLEVEEDSTG